MKKKTRTRFALLLAVCLLLALCACGGAGTQPYTVTREGKTYTVDDEQSTISDGTYTYAFAWVGDQVTLTYPDGSTYWREYDSSGWHGGWSDDYDPGSYADGAVLLDILNGQHSDPDSGSHLLLALLLLAVGIFNILSPKTAWMLSHGWRYKDAEPSDMALLANRLGGVLCVLAAVFAFFL